MAAYILKNEVRVTEHWFWSAVRAGEEPARARVGVFAA
jgi:hypothetical protein